MATTDTSKSQPQPFTGLFPPVFGDPNDIAMAATAEMPAPPAQAPVPLLPQGAGVVPKSFSEYVSDPMNVAKVPQRVGPNTPLPTLRPDQALDVVAKNGGLDTSSTPSASAVASPGAVASPSNAVPAGPPPTGPGLMQNVPQPPTFDQFLTQNGHAPVAAPPPSYRGKKLAGMGLFAAMDSIGAAFTGGHATVAPGLMQNAQENIEYNRNLPVVQHAADVAAFDKSQQGTAAGLGIQHAGIENQNLQGGLPFYQQAQSIKDGIQSLWQKGDLTPEAFDQAVKLKMQGVPANFMRFITPDFVNQVKQLPQQPPKFTVGASGIEPITYRGQNFGVSPVQGEPAEITQARQSAIDSQKQNETSKQDLKSGEFPPVVLAELGKPPLTDKAAMATYGKQAEAIMTRVSAAPKIMAQNAANGALGSAQAVPGATGDAALANLDPSTAAGVRLIGDGKADFATFTSRMPPAAKMNLAGLVLAYNPKYNQASFGIQGSTIKDSVTGDIGKQAQAFNTTIAHFGLLDKTIDNLGNGDTKILNSLSNDWKNQFGTSTAPTDFATVKQVAADEFAKAAAGMNVAQGDREKADSIFNAAMNPASLHSAIKHGLELLQGKMGSLNYTVQRGTNPGQNLPLISPEAQKTLDTLQPPAGGTGGPAVGATGTHQDGSKWQFTGGDSADLKNWKQIAPATKK